MPFTVVVDHDTGELVSRHHPGRDRKTTEKFLDLLGDERLKQIKLVSCDDADWITRPVSERCPTRSCAQPVFTSSRPPPTRWTRSAARSGTRPAAKARPSSPRELKGARFALWKNPENLTERQQLKLARIQKLNHRLYRAYLLLPAAAPRSTASPPTTRSCSSTLG